MLNYPENETLPLGDPVPPKARILEVSVCVLSTKSLVKIFWPLGVRLAHCCAGSVHSYIGGYFSLRLVTGKCTKFTTQKLAVRKFKLSNYESGVIFNQREQYSPELDPDCA
jgi:hypothetical protein